MFIRALKYGLFPKGVAIPKQISNDTVIKLNSAPVYRQNVRFSTWIKIPSDKGASKRAQKSVQTNTVIHPDVADALKNILSCNDADIIEMCKNKPNLKERGAATITDRLYFLNKIGISTTSVMENPFLLVEEGKRR